MSVIGITHKQPRVFAHDAVALEDLPGCNYRQITATSANAQGSKGEGFAANETYSALTTGAKGTVIEVEVTAVGASGDILGWTVLGTSCQSTNFNVNDKLTVIWQPTGAQGPTTPHQDAVDLIQIDALATNSWDYGCPITPLGTRFDLPGNVPETYNPMFAYKQKDIVRYQCVGDTCEREGLAPGAALYVGYDLTELTVVMESGKSVTWTNVPAGSFMPVSVLTVCNAVAAGPNPPTLSDLKGLILCLF